ncbi:hypothetical protein H4219_002053 [Mycoemilia scoparia]|uniref:Queuine tRNA-ribosyltransferase accessory subunit 2 n=1 Tax=Mycoemilia scoparia TaxID=417184 RepID=A0A9W8A4B4_9FUNG|nr:hypothetical protein H4219_002053 [Mycoemilia scoparia]
MTKALTFTVQNPQPSNLSTGSNGDSQSPKQKCRLGQLEFTPPTTTTATTTDTTKISLETPNFFQYTIQGLQPHLVPEVASHLESMPPAIRVNLEGFVKDREIPVSTEYPGKLHQFLGYPENNSPLLLLDIYDPVILERNIKPNSKSLGVDTEGGLQRITGKGLAKIVEKYRPDIFVLPADYVFSKIEELYEGKRVKKSVERTKNWITEYMDTSLSQSQKPALFVPLTGAPNETLREASVNFVKELDADGNVIDGYVISEYGIVGGYPLEKKLDMAWSSFSSLDQNKPRYMVGVSSPHDVVMSVDSAGIDLFDATYPYAVTEQGFASTYVFGDISVESRKDETLKGHISLWETPMFGDFGPLVPGCTCFACQRHTRSYVHHLLMTHEMLATVLLQIHNIHWYNNLFKAVRSSLKDGSFNEKKCAFLKNYVKQGEDGNAKYLLNELILLQSQTISPTTKAGYKKFGRRLSEDSATTA